MAVSIKLEKGSGIAVISCSGILRLDDARRGAEELWATQNWHGTSAVWDFRAARFDLSSSDIREIAAFIVDNQRREPPAKMAFVTLRDVDFGMARMFEAFRDDPRTAFCVFRDIDEAVLWARTLNPNAA